MNNGLKIAVADDEAAMQDYFEDMLTRMGHRVVSICKTGEELVEKCCADRPDLVITDIFMPDLDGIDAAARICEELPVPVILVTGQHESEVVARIEAEHIMAYLFKPIRKEHLETAIAIARQRFGQFQALVKETADLKQALHDRKIIEKAKGIIMKEAALDEDAAFRRMQRLARAKSQKLVDFATVILMAKEAFSPRDEGE